jgi:hypothetical protein
MANIGSYRKQKNHDITVYKALGNELALGIDILNLLRSYVLSLS